MTRLPGLCSGGVGSTVRPFARPPDRPETCENHTKTTKIIGKLSTTTKFDQHQGETTKNALARSPVAKGGPATWRRSEPNDPERCKAMSPSRGPRLPLAGAEPVRTSIPGCTYGQNKLTRTYIRKLKFNFWAAFRPNLAPRPPQPGKARKIM